MTHSHLDFFLWRLHADHAPVVLVPTLYVPLALLPHVPGQPHPVRMLGLGGHGRNAHWTVCVSMTLLAFSIAIVGLFALVQTWRPANLPTFPQLKQ